MPDPLDIFARRAPAAASEKDPLAVFAAPQKEDRWVRKGLFLVNERTGAKVFSPAIRGGEQTVDVPTVAQPALERRLPGNLQPIPGGLPTEQIDVDAAPAGGTPTSALERALSNPRLGGMAAGPLRALGVIGETEEEERFKKERLLSASYGPWIGLAEMVGEVPEGTREAVRENYDQAASDYLSADPQGGLGRAVSLTAGEIGASLPSPSSLAGLGAGRLGQLATRGASPATRAISAAAAGAAEQTAESYLDAKDLPLRDRLVAAGTGAGLGVLGGVSAIRSARTLPDALRTRGEKTLASAMGEPVEALPGAWKRLPDGVEELARKSLAIGEDATPAVEAMAHAGSDVSPEALNRVAQGNRYVRITPGGEVVPILNDVSAIDVRVNPGEVKATIAPDGRVQLDMGRPNARQAQTLATLGQQPTPPPRVALPEEAIELDLDAAVDPEVEALLGRPSVADMRAGRTAYASPYPDRGGDLAAFGPRLYRETNASGLRGILLGEEPPEGLFVASAPELAAGQGANRGIRVEFRSDGLVGTVHRSKPGLDFALEQGAAELRVGNPAELRSRIARVTVAEPDSLKGSYDGRLLLRQFSGWDKQRLPDGSITFEPPLAASRPGERGHLDLSTAAEDLKRWTKKNFASGGRYKAAADDFLAPEQRAFVGEEIPRRLEGMEGRYRVALAGKDDILTATDKAVRMVAKTREQRAKLYADMHLASIGEKPLTDLPEPVRPIVARANDFVRNLSEEGLATGALPEELRPKVEAQQGAYRHRAYAAFDDPDHFRKVKQDEETWGAAYEYLRKEISGEDPRPGSKVTVEGQPAEVIQAGMRAVEARRIANKDPAVRATIAAHRAALAARQMTQADFLSRFKAEINVAAQQVKIAHADDLQVRLADGTEKTVKRGTINFGSEKEIHAAVTGIMNALADRPQGAEALVIASGAPSRINSILKQRSNIPAPLRKLMGEYTDFRVSLEKTVHNLAWDIETYKMLRSLADDGSALGVFRSEAEGPSGNLYQPVAGNASESGLGSRSPLAGMLTAPELRKALASEVEMAKIGWWSRLAGWTKAGKVVQNPGGIARNFYSHVITTTANGRNAVNPRLWSEVRRYYGDPALRDRAIAEGIIGDGFASREVEDYIRWIEASNNPAAAGYAALSKKFAKAFRFGDDVWRLYNWIGETEDQMAARGLSRPEAEALAADRVKDTFQTYSRAPEIANRIRRNPILGSPAATFTIEGVRNVKNIAKYAAQDIREGLATGNPKLVAMGSRKVVGLLVAGLAIQATGKAAQKLAGVTEEQMQGLRRQVVPRYHQDSELVILSAKPGKSVSYIDLSFLNPYNGITKPLIAAANKGEGAALVAVLEQIAGGDIAAENVFELATGKRVESTWPLRTRGEVFSWDEPAGDIAKKAGYHAYRGFAPQFLVQGENLARAAGVLPQPDDGFQRELGNELASTAGFRTTKLDLPQRMGASMGGFASRHGEHMKRIKRGLESGAAEPDGALNVYDASYQELRTMVSDYRALGMGDRDLFMVAKDKGIPKPLISCAVRGEEDPPPPILRPGDPAEAENYRALMAHYWQRYSE